MENKAKHTPTPWLNALHEATKSGELVFVLPPHDYEYAKKCVNNHERLLAEIETLRQALGNISLINNPQKLIDGNSKMGDENRVNWNYAIFAKQALSLTAKDTIK